MSVGLGRRRLVGLWAWTIVFAATFGATPARAESVVVNVDKAKVMRLPAQVSTIVIGNPLIADVSLQSGGMVVVTGKGFGTTNMLALDKQGRVLMDSSIQVVGAGTEDVVVVYRGFDRESYSCAPECERRITLGDSTAFFGAAIGQSAARAGQAQAGAPTR